MSANFDRLFDQGPPFDWTPQEGERVAVYIGGAPGGFVFEEGIVRQRFEVAHYTGNPIVSYHVDFPGGARLQVSKNNMRPLPECAAKLWNDGKPAPRTCERCGVGPCPLGIVRKPIGTIALAYFAASGLPEPEPELRFHPTRRWRFDYGWREQKVALEVDGAVFTQGRHTRGAGVLKDMEKLNAAAVLGWRVLKCTPKQLCSGEIMPTLREALSASPPGDSPRE
jgi:hypothetical protein